MGTIAFQFLDLMALPSVRRSAIALLIAGVSDGRWAWVPSLASETRVVVAVSRSWTNTSVQ